jgi:hypothetical protein
MGRLASIHAQRLRDIELYHQDPDDYYKKDLHVYRLNRYPPFGDDQAADEGHAEEEGTAESEAAHEPHNSDGTEPNGPTEESERASSVGDGSRATRTPEVWNTQDEAAELDEMAARQRHDASLNHKRKRSPSSSAYEPSRSGSEDVFAARRGESVSYGSCHCEERRLRAMQSGEPWCPSPSHLAPSVCDFQYGPVQQGHGSRESSSDSEEHVERLVNEQSAEAATDAIIDAFGPVSSSAPNFIEMDEPVEIQSRYTRRRGMRAFTPSLAFLTNTLPPRSEAGAERDDQAEIPGSPQKSGWTPASSQEVPEPSQSPLDTSIEQVEKSDSSPGRQQLDATGHGEESGSQDSKDSRGHSAPAPDGVERTREYAIITGAASAAVAKDERIARMEGQLNVLAEMLQANGSGSKTANIADMVSPLAGLLGGASGKAPEASADDPVLITAGLMEHAAQATFHTGETLRFVARLIRSQHQGRSSAASLFGHEGGA